MLIAMSDYKILLPQTDFPMKAKLAQTEPARIAQWEDQKLYQKILKKRDSAPLFFMPDGPPYANGPIHIGHAFNKILKDIVIKYKNLKGLKAPFIPSWDCHGLPIELEALKQSADKPSPSDLRKLCRQRANHWIKEQEQSFKRLGVLAHWEQKVLTMDPEYSAQQIRAFAQLVKKGLIAPGKKPVFWCFKLQTALAFSEAEYRQHQSPSIYVRFALDKSSREKLKSSQATFAVIWTTTPWTLPANTAICVHPDLNYGLFSNSKESYLLEISLAESFFKEAGLSGFDKKAQFKGSQLEFLQTQHPFINRKSPLVLGDHVGKDTGTGLVHTAPGHGLEDHQVGKKYQLPAPCPVDARGHFTKETPDFLRGLFIFKGNKILIEKLKASGHLMAHKNIQHSYPYNPRSQSPLIYRSTDQWFLSLDKGEASVRKQALKACEDQIHFVPDWGKARLTAMIKNSPDWCLSRQRVWGVPLVVFYCKKCSQAFLDPSCIEAIADKIEKQGLDYYYNSLAGSLMPKDSQCLKCGHKEFKKGEDILDVWFDSGVQHELFSKIKGFKTPYELFLEGSDQHRGWFQTSLLSSVALNSHSPFKTLLTHGFINDEKGYKMSKSKGNVLSPEKLIQNKGAEIIRLWVASENFALDLKAGEENFKRVAESYRRYRNSFRWLLGNLNDFDPKTPLEFKKLGFVDQWVLIQLKQLINSCKKDYDNYAFYKIYQKWNQFFTVDLSAFYFDIIKDRLYTFPKNSAQRRQAQGVLYQLLDQLLPLMAPVTSFLSEEAYSYFNKTHKKESVFLENFPTAPEEWENPEVPPFFESLFPLREKLNKQLEILRQEGKISSNLQAQAQLTLKKDFISKNMSHAEQLEFFSVSQFSITEGSPEALTSQPATGEKCLRCWFISPQLNPQKLCPKCVKNLN